MMQCEHAYTDPKVRGILCKKCDAPCGSGAKGVVHALCGHQRFCPTARCYTLLPGWEKCVKRRVSAETAETAKAAEQPKPKRRSKKSDT